MIYKGTEVDFSKYVAIAPENKKTEKDIATLPGFSAIDLTLPEAVKKLNREIRENHPGKDDLLVAYVAPNNLPDPDKKISIELINNPPIEVIVQHLTGKSLTHWSKGVSQLTIYGWHRPQIVKEER
ncbi:hypothetical protein N9A94_07785 [Akkermansiaceae bacterium]|nr:hypothetical protein [Akkermansiaceae bacterium]